MSTIREAIEQHKGLVLKAGQTSGTVEITTADLHELMYLAHEAIHPTDPEDDDDTGIERGYDEGQLRMVALGHAVQLDMQKIQAAHGLDATFPDSVATAESFLTFLQG